VYGPDQIQELCSIFSNSIVYVVDIISIVTIIFLRKKQRRGRGEKKRGEERRGEEWKKGVGIER